MQYCLAAGATHGNIPIRETLWVIVGRHNKQTKIKNENSYNNWGDIWNR